MIGRGAPGLADRHYTGGMCFRSLCLALPAALTGAQEAPPAALPCDFAAGDLRVINDDGGWCWFEGERAIIHDGWLLVGSVASGHADQSRRGDIEVAARNLATGEQRRITLHDDLQLDDHDSPALLPMADGSILAAWSKHGPENCFYVARSAAGDDLAWSEPAAIVPSESSRITYSNLYRLSDENDRIYNFFRGLDNSWKPSFAYSDDEGVTWAAGSVVIDVPTEQRHRPYVRYAGDGESRIHLLYTEGHPRNFDNSVYHVYYEDGALKRTDGREVATLREGLSRPEDGTLVYRGDADRVAWVMDLRLDEEGHPVGLFSVQMNSAGMPPRTGGDDHRYFYARFDGSAWRTQEIAHAGTRLYAGEDDYTGLGVIDPNDVNRVYISTNADPVTGEPLISSADDARHWEIYRGRTADGGATWTWEPVTEDSDEDNLRPIVVPGDAAYHVLLWLRGEYRSYTDYTQQVVGLIEERRRRPASGASK